MEVKATVKFTEAQVAEIIVEHIKRHYPSMKNVDKAKVRFSVSSGSLGHGMSGPSFNNAEVEITLAADQFQ